MSMSLEYMIETEYIPFYTKEELLVIADKWVTPDAAKKFINENYDRIRKFYDTPLQERLKEANKYFDAWLQEKPDESKTVKS